MASACGFLPSAGIIREDGFGHCGRDSAYYYPFKCGLEGFQVGTGEPLLALHSPLIDAEGEAWVLVTELLCDVDGVIANGLRRCAAGSAETRDR